MNPILILSDVTARAPQTNTQDMLLDYVQTTRRRETSAVTEENKSKKSRASEEGGGGEGGGGCVECVLVCTSTR